jgi:energy-converting hydrogenase Eha subunit G
MKELFRDLGMMLSGVLLVFGAYLVYDAVSNHGEDLAGKLILGAVLCSLALVAGHSSIRIARSLREWKRHTQGSREPRKIGS